MKEALLRDLRKLGICEGDTVLVHSSMKAIGTTLTPEEVIDVLQKAVGASGTLLFPAFTYKYVYPENPRFVSDKTEPCIGLLPRTFFRMPGVVRSSHPTHSVCARGLHAKELTGSQHLDTTPVGPNSPYMKLPGCHGKILFIGELLDCCTFMHGVEERVGTDYVLTEEKIHYIVDGEDRYLFGHDFKGWSTRYSRIKELLTGDELVTGSFGHARCYIVDPAALLKKASAKIREDMHWFVTDASAQE